MSRMTVNTSCYKTHRQHNWTVQNSTNSLCKHNIIYLLMINQVNNCYAIIVTHPRPQLAVSSLTCFLSFPLHTSGAEVVFKGEFFFLWPVSRSTVSVVDDISSCRCAGLHNCLAFAGLCTGRPKLVSTFLRVSKMIKGHKYGFVLRPVTGRIWASLDVTSKMRYSPRKGVQTCRPCRF